jgi:hypothetical protein
MFIFEDSEEVIKSSNGKKSEAVNTRRSDNALAKIKTSKGQTTIYKTIHIKLTSVKHSYSP